MKKLAYIVCASLCLTVPAFAQSNAAAPAGDQAATGQKGEKMKELVQGCRKEAQGQGLKPQSHEMRQAVMECVGKENPRMAKVMGCRFEAMDKGLKPKSDEMKTFVKDCMHKSS